MYCRTTDPKFDINYVDQSHGSVGFLHTPLRYLSHLTLAKEDFCLVSWLMVENTT